MVLHALHAAATSPCRSEYGTRAKTASCTSSGSLLKGASLSRSAGTRAHGYAAIALAQMHHCVFLSTNATLEPASPRWLPCLFAPQASYRQDL